MAPTVTNKRLISADDHVDLGHDKIKSHLAPKYHDEYDRALKQFRASMGSMASAEANQLWREQQGLPAEQGRGLLSAMEDRHHPAAGRKGHTDALERLADMDTDGVQASSSL